MSRPHRFTPTPYLALLAVAATASLLWPTERTAARSTSQYTMEVLVDGVPLSEYAARGTTYVEAIAGKEYSVRLTNRTGERVAVALSIDGLNSIDAKTTSARDARKWILGPWETVVLDGWQTSQTTARRFFFTTEQNSYGAWLGKTRNLGLVSAAFFRERRVEPLRSREWSAPAPSSPSREDSSNGAASGLQEKDARQETKKSERANAPNDELAATGIGRETGHEVRHVEFDSEESPAASVELRYEYRDALVRLGVLPRPRPACDDDLARREGARGFSDEYAPDPYRHGR